MSVNVHDEPGWFVITRHDGRRVWTYIPSKEEDE